GECQRARHRSAIFWPVACSVAGQCPRWSGSTEAIHLHGSVNRFTSFGVKGLRRCARRKLSDAPVRLLVRRGKPTRRQRNASWRPQQQGRNGAAATQTRDNPRGGGGDGPVACGGLIRPEGPADFRGNSGTSPPRGR